jgi:hypothetical protein
VAFQNLAQLGNYNLNSCDFSGYQISLYILTGVISPFEAFKMIELYCISVSSLQAVPRKGISIKKTEKVKILTFDIFFSPFL